MNRRARWNDRLRWGVIGALCVLPLALPSDAPWINDEPQLIFNAMKYNIEGRLAPHGLEGNLRVRYGPLPTWFYQAAVAFSHEPAQWVLMRAALFTAITALSLMWLARSLGWWPWFVPVVLASPYLWFYARLLWDNSFLIPLSALAIASYAALLARPHRFALAAFVLSLGSLPLVHLMCVALVVPIAIHFAATQWRTLRRFSITFAAAAAAWVAMAWSYLGYLADTKLGSASVSAAGLDGWWFSLWGGRFLTAWGFDYFFDGDWIADYPGWPRPFLRALVWLSMAGILLVWSGMILAMVRTARAIRNRPLRTPATNLCTLCLAVIVAQTLLNGITRSYGHPHYYNGTWIAFVVLAWSAVEALRHLRFAPAALASYGAAVAVVTLFIIARIHETAGTRGDHYGPVLAEQTRVARIVAQFSPQSQIYKIRGEHMAKFPRPLKVLQYLTPYLPQPDGPRSDLLICYSSDDPRYAHMTVRNFRTREIISTGR